MEIVEIRSDEIGEKEEKHRGPLRGLSTNYILDPNPRNTALAGDDEEADHHDDLHSITASNKENTRVTRTSRGELEKPNYDMK